MAATLSALPIRLGTGALRHPACHISGLHIARQAKSHVVNMAVPKSFSNKSSCTPQKRMGTIERGPKFVSKGPPIRIPTFFVLFSTSCFLSLMEKTFHFITPVEECPDPKPVPENTILKMMDSQA